MRILDIIFAVPTLVKAILLLIAAARTDGYERDGEVQHRKIGFVYALPSGIRPGGPRIRRRSASRVWPHVEAARSLGASDVRIVATAPDFPT